MGYRGVNYGRLNHPELLDRSDNHTRDGPKESDRYLASVSTAYAVLFNGFDSFSNVPVVRKEESHQYNKALLVPKKIQLEKG